MVAFCNGHEDFTSRHYRIQQKSENSSRSEAISIILNSDLFYFL